MSQSPGVSSQGENYVVGIGASAGGLEALTQFVSHLTSAFRGTLILAQHLAPHSKSLLAEIIARAAKLPVETALDQAVLGPGRIYVIPPNHDVDIQEGRLVLTVAGEETRPKPSVDGLFISLARAYGPSAVGVVLSGTGSDGSEGIRAIKAAGGLTLAQDEKSAKYDGMPRAAIDTGSIDNVLSAKDMASELLSLLNDHQGRAQVNQIGNESLDEIFALVEARTGSNFRAYKPTTMRRRTAKRIAELSLKSPAAYVDHLKHTPGEIEELTNELLISVTTFFRDAEVFEALAGQIGEIIAAKKAGQDLRIWVAACATGEEAYSIAMLVADCLERERKGLHVKIFATDLDHDAIVEARAGLYSPKDIRAVPEKFREKYFSERNANFWEVKKSIRDIVVFARQDLATHPPFTKVDLISCRNVMIYFEPPLQQKVIDTFHYALLANGVLVLGKSESPGALGTMFEAIDRKARIFRRTNVATQRLATPGRTKREITPFGEPPRKRAVPGEPTVNLAELATKRLLAAYQLSGVVIDEEASIVQIVGDVTPYLSFHNAQANLKLPNLLPQGVGVEIPLLLRKVKIDGGAHRSRLHRNAAMGVSYVMCVRALEESADSRLFLVNFEPRTHEVPVTDKESSAEDNNTVADLERELTITREHLQQVIQELGVSNEELQSLNEEMTSTNEELQASNEELETTNEELQSTNEELTTLNEEMSVKSGELRLMNASLENVQNSIGSPLIVLDEELKLVRYNADALKVFPLTPGDINREITRVSSLFEIENFEQILHTAIDERRVVESICESPSGLYQLRVLPALDEKKNVNGVIAVFIDNTALIRAKESLGASETRVRSILESSAALITLKDAAGRYLIANKSFIDAFGLTEEQVIGRTDREILPEALASDFREADLEIILKRASLRREEDFVLRGGRKACYMVSRFPLTDVPSAAPYAIGMIAFDITALNQAQRELRLSEARYRAVAEDQAVYVCRHGVAPNFEINYLNNFLHLSLGGIVPAERFDQIFPVAERERVTNEISLIAPDRPVVQYEVRFGRSGASDRWVRWIHRGIFDQAGHVSEFQAVGFDVTEYRNATDQLLRTEAIFTGIFNNTTDFIMVVRVGDDGGFYLESLNRSAEKTMGYAYTQLIGRRLEEFFTNDRSVEIIARYREAVRTKKPDVFEEELHFPGGMKNFATTIVPIPSADGTITRVAALSRDVSGYKTIERDLRKAKDDAEIANRAKSDFLASMSHELRTPLNVVLGLAQLLEGTTLDQEQGGYVKSIHRSGRVLLALIEDVLDISKIEAGKVRLEHIAFGMRDVVNETLDLFSAQAAEKHLQLSASISSEAERTVIGDPGRVRQILVNFVSNALKFTDRGSIQIIVNVEKTEGPVPTFIFDVADTGIGIRSEDHDKIFQKFSQVQSGNARRYGGTGLGLVISKHLANLMGGDIGFRSQQGKGSTFWFKVPLPVVNRIEASRRAAAAPRLASVGSATDALAKVSQPLRVLAVDDNRESQAVIALLLKRMGHITSTASSGQEAIDTLKANPIDVVLMDIQMPDMDGYEAAGHIRRLPDPLNRTPIIALTANALAGDAEKCLRAGMDAYLTKPVRAEALREAIAKWAPALKDEPALS